MESLTSSGSNHGDKSLRETMLTLQRDFDALSMAYKHSEHLLEALDSLLEQKTPDPENAPLSAYARVFDALQKAFTFTHVLLLAETPNGDLECLMAEPANLVRSRWPLGPLFAKVIAGKTVTTFDNSAYPEWTQAALLGLNPQQSALYSPIRTRDGRGLMMLLREVGQKGFDRSHVQLASHFSVLASHVLAAHFASQNAEESSRLRSLSQKLRASERAAQRNADLLTKLVNVLPVGVTVQDQQGRLLIVNDTAAKSPTSHASLLIGHTPFETLHDPQLRQQEQQKFTHRLNIQDVTTEEETLSLDGEIRTLLKAQKTVHLFDEIVMVTTTLDISERKRIENEMTYRAFHDPLTGLPNRALLMERVDALLDAADEASPFALAFINLDDFKQVNECYSHAIGDQVLIAVAGRIQKYMRESDILARMNGDEFMLLASPLKGAEELTPLMDSLANAIRRPFEIEGHPLMISASIGVSLYPNHGQNYEALLRAADSAMYLAKKSNRGGVSYFDPKMAEAVAARMALEQRLRTAIHAGHFRAALQPKVLLDSGKIMGFEALVRWVQPDGKVNMPGMFIQLATDLCLIDDITRLVMKDILQALPSLRSQFGNDISVSINIGARQAGDTEFMKSLVEQIERSGEAGYLVVEITEDAFLATQCFQQQVLPELRRIGVTVSIDDFGTGYSSLSMLADVTADEVKVDRAFITSIQDRPRSQGILKAIESLCTALDIAMVAEGIETKEELAYLHENTSIAQAQGYFFGKPAFLEHWVPEPIDDVLDLDWGLPPPASFSGTLKVLSS